MFLSVDTNITIMANPEAIWDFACNPINWTASNPTEHFGLHFDSKDNLPHTGVTFIQHESVAGIRAILKGRFHYMNRPHVAFWTGTATYSILGGLISARLPEGGVIIMNFDDSVTHLEHNVYIDFPDSLWGKLCLWFFEKHLNGKQAVYDHAFKELVFFKKNLEIDTIQS